MRKFTIILATAAAMLGGTAANAQKVGYVNMQDVVTAMPEAARADTALQQYQQQLYQEYQAMQEELQTESEAFVKDSLKMTDVTKQVKRNSLQDLNLRMLQFRQAIDQQVSRKYNELMKPVSDKARAAVEAVAKAGGYAYVINDAQVAGLPLLTTKSAQDDLTAAVKTKLGLK